MSAATLPRAGTAAPRERSRKVRGAALYLLKRVGLLAFVLWGVVSFLFVLARMSGDPAVLFSEPDATEAQIQLTRERFGLDKPLHEQYFSALAGALRLDFGTSYTFGLDAAALVAERMALTLQVLLPGLVIGVAAAFVVGIYAALKRSKARSRVLMSAAFLLDGIPYFFLALLLVLAFSLTWRLLPATGSGTPAHTVLPIAVLALSSVATLSRLVRGQFLDVLGEGHIQMARSKGISPARVLFRHAMPTALPPLVSFVGLLFSISFGSLVVLEPIFNYGGLGALLVRSVTTRDFPVVQAGVFAIAALITVINLAIDAIVTLMDPRLRTKVAK
ncbi:MAG: ABC transporter permease [Arthrobacter sp.]